MAPDIPINCRPGEPSTSALAKSDNLKKVLLSFPSTFGVLGIGQGGLKIARALQTCGWSVTAIVSTMPNRMVPFEVRVADASVFSRISLCTPLRFSEALMADVAYKSFDWFASRRISSSEIFYGYTEASLHSMRRAAAAGAITVLHAANTYLPKMRALLEAEYHRLGLGASPVSSIAVHKALREYAEADLVRVQSTMVYDSLLAAGIPEGKVALVSPSVDLDEFLPSNNQPERFTVAYVGAFSVRKGIHHLLAAWDRLHLPEALLILHGGWGTRWAKQLLAKYRDRKDIEFASGAPHLTYRRASVCAIPSMEDGFCYVVLEAMACGLPVILTDHVGGKDMVAQGEEGLIVPAGDVDALAEAIADLYLHRSKAQAMGKSARQRAERQTHYVEGLALSHLFDRALSEPGRPAVGVSR
jgi:glycosyltransferase involved in cell wall biosynthesis